MQRMLTRRARRALTQQLRALNISAENQVVPAGVDNSIQPSRIRQDFQDEADEDPQEERMEPEEEEDDRQDPPVHIISEEVELFENSCVICQLKLDKEIKQCRPDGCDHRFHLHCLQNWIKNESSCPTCRSNINALIPFEAEEMKEEDQIQVQPRNQGGEHFPLINCWVCNVRVLETDVNLRTATAQTQALQCMRCTASVHHRCLSEAEQNQPINQLRQQIRCPACPDLNMLLLQKLEQYRQHRRKSNLLFALYDLSETRVPYSDNSINNRLEAILLALYHQGAAQEISIQYPQILQLDQQL